MKWVQWSLTIARISSCDTQRHVQFAHRAQCHGPAVVCLQHPCMSINANIIYFIIVWDSQIGFLLRHLSDELAI